MFRVSGSVLDFRFRVQGLGLGYNCPSKRYTVDGGNLAPPRVPKVL